MLKTKSVLQLLVFVSCFFLLQSKVMSNLLGDYIHQESQEVEQRRTVSSGSRSSCQSSVEENSISLLVPEEEVVHRTSSQRPTLYVSTSKAVISKPLKFTLVNPRTFETLIEQNFSVLADGIKKITLPEDVKLSPDEIYLWYVSIPCSNELTEYREVLSAAIIRRQLSQEMKIKLQQTQNQLEVAEIYAENGFWYDALELLIEQNVQDSSNYLQQLLNSAGLSLPKNYDT